MASVTFDKSKAFAVRIVKLYKWLKESHQEFVLSKQLLRAGTSIGANLAEARGGITKADFVNKLHIALKECKETVYWLELLHATDYLTAEQYESINADAVELEKLLTASLKTLKNQQQPKS